MNSFRKSDEILSEWNAVASRARPPERAPRGSVHRATGLRLGFAGLVAALIVAAVAVPQLTSTALIAGSPSASAAVASASAAPSSSASTATRPSASASSRLTGDYDPVGPDALTDGVMDNWKSMTWTKRSDPMPLTGHAFRWQGKQLMVGRDPTSLTAPQLYLSNSSQNWVPVLRAPFGLQVAASGLLLLAIASDLPSEYSTSTDGPGTGTSGDPNTAPQTAWTSLDGVHWSKIGTPRGVDHITALAGREGAGFVALASKTGANGNEYSLARSADGIAWTSEPIPGGGSPMALQSNPNAFYLTTFRTAADAPGVPIGQIWRSVDGKSWTQSADLGKGSVGGWIDFAQRGETGGMVMVGSSYAVPGGQQLWTSTDDGKTWALDPKGGPLGFTSCSGECAVDLNGRIASDGHRIVAVKGDGKASVSEDGRTWTSLDWNGGPTDIQSIVVVWQGVVIETKGSEWWYGAAK